MAPSDCKNKGAESHGYKAVIEWPDCHKIWAEFVKAQSLPNAQELEREGWLTAKGLGLKFNLKPTAIMRRIRKYTANGVMEKRIAMERDTTGKSRPVPIYRPKPRPESA